VSAGVIATVFVIVAVAELPDKTMIATLVMGSRARPLFVWIGAAAAFTVHVTLAVVAGRLLTLLPHTALEIVVTVLFLGGAAYLIFVPETSETAKGRREAEPEHSGTPWRVIGTAFGVILIGEFGDLTQLLIVNFVARTHKPVSVFVGGLAALLCVSAIGAFGGRALLRLVPLAVVRRAGGVVLLGFAAYSIYALVTP
jgi:putative Ca2+/H+ antiporter (TMEM165/GDT1 family)